MLIVIKKEKHLLPKIIKTVKHGSSKLKDSFKELIQAQYREKSDLKM